MGSPTRRRNKPGSGSTKPDAAVKTSGASGAGADAVQWRVFAENPAKAWAEKFFVLWAFCGWVPLMTYIVYSGMYEWFEEVEYFVVGCILALPCFVVPALWPWKPDGHLPFHQQYWFKANVWVWTFSYVGNYFWTHYFYNLLGATYTFKAWRLNNVPIAMFLCTVGYFSMYFSLINMALRALWTSAGHRRMPAPLRLVVSALVIFALSVFTAFMETWTISAFPYYAIRDRAFMYTIGSVLYSIYFVVGFPMHFYLDEDASKPWSAWDALKDSLAASMTVTILLDLWRLAIGGLGHVDTFCM
ncbi:CPI1 [Symbiodinium sp. KB8]|nr:CPI1 [Symbiodinium sp. KB8]